jgi:hypothetical protein
VGLPLISDARYLVEDVPYGLVVTRGIAELAGVKTPVIDQVITWSQERMGLGVFERWKAGWKRPDLSTRAPQRYGIDRLELLSD